MISTRAYFTGALLTLLVGCGTTPEPNAANNSPTVSTTANAPPASSAGTVDPSKKSLPTTPSAPQERSASKQPATGSFQITNDALELPGPVLFATGKASLLPQSEPVLAHVTDFLGAKPDITALRIEVHSDNQGNAAMNQQLTAMRALEIAKALVARGVDCKRLVPVGFGDSKPIADNNNAEGRAQNRRSVFAPAALRGRAIGGMPLDGGGQPAGDPCTP
jgi:OOP family OmpA-OmpF porin